MRIQAVVTFAAIALAAQATTQPTQVTITVDTAVVRGPLTPIWAWFGND